MSKMKKPKSIRPPMPIVSCTSTGNPEADRLFELELCWCVQQLETALSSGKLSQKVAEDTVKNLKILKGNNAPIIKKRQCMKSALGDYRAKMKEEEKKMGLLSKQIKFTPKSAEVVKKSSFVKKSAILNSDKDFKFNFNADSPIADAANNGNEVIADKEAQSTLTTDYNAKKLNLTSGNGFTFNFAIDEVNDEINLDGLTIKN